MVFTYKRQTSRQSWPLESMNEAVKAVIRGEMGYHRASVQFNVPQTTLERYVGKQKNNPETPILKTLGSKKPVFTPEQEEEIASHLKSMEERLFGLTMEECRRLAFQLAEENAIDHPFNKTEKIAGKGWMVGFLKRHPELSIRKPEATSGNRARGFNKVAVSQFFKLLGELVEKYQFTAERIFNVDETGVTANPKGTSKITATKGRQQVGALTSGERGELVTAEICFSAAGAYMPPMLIFPRKRMQQGFLDGLVPGGWVELNQKGWIDMNLFFEWFKRFVVFSKASKDSPVLLLLDGHSSHTKNLQVIKYARENNVILLCFPPHTTHKLQALDVAFMKPLSLYYDDEVRKWLRTNPGRVVTFHQLSALFSAAYVRAATMQTAINGFRKTGVWPVDSSVFSDADFLPSVPTEIEEGGNSSRDELHQTTSTPTSSATATSDAELIHSGEKTPEKKTEPIVDPQPGTSKMNDSAFPRSGPRTFIPVPKIDQKTKRSSRKKGKTAILTSTPYKEELEQSLQEKKKEKTPKQKAIKRKIDSEDKKHKESTKSIKKKKGKKEWDDSSGSEEQEDGDAECLYCEELYSKSCEGWIACSTCLRWAHNSCAGMDDEEDDIVFVCELCQP